MTGALDCVITDKISFRSDQQTAAVPKDSVRGEEAEFQIMSNLKNFCNICGHKKCAFNLYFLCVGFVLSS